MAKRPFSNKVYRPDRISTYFVEHDSELLKFLQEVLAQRSRTEVKSMMQHGHVAINDIPTTLFNAPLVAGDKLTINWVRPFPVLKSPMLRILFEDDALVIVEKKSGLLSVTPAGRKDKSAQTILDEYFSLGGAHDRAFVVHRLDQFTSGILIFAKSLRVQQMLRESWTTYVVDRRYIAITEHVPAQQKGEVVSYLTENSRMKVYSTNDPTQGKLAVTRYEVKKVVGDYAQVELQILTGRKNQIRVHLSELGCPVAGDRKYGAVTNPVGRLMLHNYLLQFVHPITKENLTFELPLPPKFDLR